MGYFHTLPFTFWIATALLTIASALLWRAPREHKALLALQIGLFVAMVWFTPLFLGRTLTGTRYSFMVHTLTQYILRYGHLDPVSQWYHNWPGFNLTEATLIEIGGIANTDAFVIWAQAPVQFAVILSLCMFVRRTLGSNNHWAVAVWFFVIFNWTAQTYYSPQTLGILLLLALFFLLNIGFTKSNADFSLRLAGILVIVGLTMTHLLTALTGFFVIAVFEGLAIYRKRMFPTLTLVFAAFILVWQVFYAGLFFGKSLLTFLDQAFNFELMWFRNVTRAQLGSEGHIVVVNTKIWLTLAAGVIALCGLALSRRFKALGDGPVLLMGIGVFIMLPFQFYGNEFLSRLFIYILPVFAYFAAKLLRTRLTELLLVLALIVALPFGIIGLHGNAVPDDVTPGQLAYWNFIQNSTYGGNLGLGGVTGAWTFGYAGRYVAGFDWIKYGSNWTERLAIRGWVVPGMANYLTFGGYEDAGFRLWTDFPEAVKELSVQADGMTDMTRFYHNGSQATSYYQDGVLLPYYPSLK